MGFLDKAKKLAEQAQTKLDEVRQQINKQESSAGGPITEYDQHGRPIPPEKTASPPHGDPLRPGAAAPPTPTPHAGPPAPPAPGVPPTEPPSGPPAPVEGETKPPEMPGAPGAEDRNRPSYDPPTLTDGDPLAG